ncbi:SAM dependent carboxyl methyltransferase - like 10, partial [Theobroma cacao]
VVFNNIVSNDFNTLFKSLPSDRQYFVAGVPRRFQGRLFFKAFLHFVHSSYALLCLLNAPKELMDKNSHSYSAQFTKILSTFWLPGQKSWLTVDSWLLSYLTHHQHINIING